jgi:hypothetical protein
MYAKVFASLWDGTLAEPYSRWAVFVFMLAHSDADGNLDMTAEAIARRSCVPLEEVRTAIAHMEAPDPSSRSSEEDGRRLVRIDGHREWGWHIVNYLKYRGLRDLDERRRQTREAVSRHRVSQGKPDVSQGKPVKAQGEAEAEEEVEAEGEAGGSKAQKAGRKAARPALALPSLEEVRAYCAERLAVGRPQVDPETWFDHYSANGWKVGKNPMRDWRAAVRTWERNGVSRGGAGPKPSLGRKIMEFGNALKRQEESREQG